MRDPRLAEIAFLTDLERSEFLHITSNQFGDSSGATVGGDKPRSLYGMDAMRWRDMIFHLLLHNLIVGGAQRESSGSLNEGALRNERSDMLARLGAGHTIMLNLSHAGRVHLWNLRDALTRDPDLEPFGLRSRAAWDRDLFVGIRFASEDSPLSVMFLDLDNFGAVNKMLGAVVGDAVLRVVFGLIKNIVGTRGAAYRYGGEEVGVLLPGVSQDVAAKLAEDLRATIERDTHAQVPELAGPQTASIGVMAFVGHAENDAIVAKADALMRAAKQAGKNRVESAS